MANNMSKLINEVGASLSYGDILAAEVLAKISATIFKARIDRGLTQKEFASLLGVSQSMISKWESEDYNFSVEALSNICDKLDWDMSVEMKPRSSNSFRKINSLANKNWITKNSLKSSTVRFEVAS